MLNCLFIHIIFVNDMNISYLATKSDASLTFYCSILLFTAPAITTTILLFVQCVCGMDSHLIRAGPSLVIFKKERISLYNFTNYSLYGNEKLVEYRCSAKQGVSLKNICEKPIFYFYIYIRTTTWQKIHKLYMHYYNTPTKSH